MDAGELTDDIVLEAALAYQDPLTNLRIVRLPAKVLFQLDLLIEDVVQVEGGALETKMDVLVWGAYPEDEGKLVARLNKPVMDALELKEGDFVTVRLSPFQLAAKERKEDRLSRNRGVRALTPDDLAAADVAMTDKLLAEKPEDVAKDGGIVLVPGKDGSIFLVGVPVEEPAPEQETQAGLQGTAISEGQPVPESTGQETPHPEPEQATEEVVVDVEIEKQRIVHVETETTRMRIVKRSTSATKGNGSGNEDSVCESREENENEKKAPEQNSPENLNFKN